jgi:hypothetical protein
VTVTVTVDTAGSVELPRSVDELPRSVDVELSEAVTPPWAPVASIKLWAVAGLVQPMDY